MRHQTVRDRIVLLAALVVALGVVAGVGVAGAERGTKAQGRVLRVPAKYASIQDAVDSAKAGDLVLIAPGVYHEAVDITTNNLTIRGEDRNTTILDGEFELDNGIRVVGADGVAIENLTARNYAFNGFFWTGVDGFRGSYLTAVRNGDYGIYAFGSVNGLFEHSYGSGSPDAGFYLGQCYPCNTVIRDVLSEYNGLGYSGTNSGGGLYLVESVFRHNRAGIVPNSGSYELCYPQRNTVIVGNLVYDNNNPETPAIDAALLGMGNGILVAGGRDNTIERNRVLDQEIGGIALVPFPEDNPSDAVPTEDPGPCKQESGSTPKREGLPSAILWPSEGNVVRENVVEGSGVADLSTADLGVSATPDGGNCFSHNQFTTSAPTNLEQKAPCGKKASGDFEEGALDLVTLIAAPKPPSVDYQVAPTPDPPKQPNMPKAKTAPANPATNVPPKVKVKKVPLPKPPGA